MDNSTTHMTDQETFTALLASAGIATKLESHSPFPSNTILKVSNAGEVGGYQDFGSYWHFNSDGKLIGVAHYE